MAACEVGFGTTLVLAVVAVREGVALGMLDFVLIQERNGMVTLL